MQILTAEDASGKEIVVSEVIVSRHRLLVLEGPNVYDPTIQQDS